MFQQRRFDFQGLNLSFLDSGGELPIALFLHGTQEHARCWERVASRFVANYRVILPDLRGHGFSDWSSGGAYSVLDYSLDLLALVEHLEADRVVLVGHSLGGNIAMHFAALYPNRAERLCIIEGLGMSPQDRQRRDARSRLELLRNWSNKVMQRSHRTPTRYKDVAQATTVLLHHDRRIAPELATHIAKHGLREMPSGGFVWRYDARVLEQGAADVLSPDPADLCVAISAPVLLVYGKQSWASNPIEDGRADYFDDVNVILVGEAGHNVHHHQPEIFIQQLKKFLGIAGES